MFLIFALSKNIIIHLTLNIMAVGRTFDNTKDVIKHMKCNKSNQYWFNYYQTNEDNIITQKMMIATIVDDITIELLTNSSKKEYDDFEPIPNRLGWKTKEVLVSEGSFYNI